MEENIRRHISRQNLKNHNIFYEPEVYNPKDALIQFAFQTLPDHVDAVREALLTFESIVPREWENHLREEYEELKIAGRAEDIGPAWTHHPPPSALVREKRYERDIQEHSVEWKAAHENLKCSESVAKRAHELLADLEAEWNHFWRARVFKVFSDEAHVRPELR